MENRLHIPIVRRLFHHMDYVVFRYSTHYPDSPFSTIMMAFLLTITLTLTPVYRHQGVLLAALNPPAGSYRFR